MNDQTAPVGNAQSIAGTIILEEWKKQWTPTLEDAERAAARVLAMLVDRCVICTDSDAHEALSYHGHNAMLRVAGEVDRWRKDTGL